jgi:hypothetical protein
LRGVGGGRAAVGGRPFEADWAAAGRCAVARARAAENGQVFPAEDHVTGVGVIIVSGVHGDAYNGTIRVEAELSRKRGTGGRIGLWAATIWIRKINRSTGLKQANRPEPIATGVQVAT